MELGVLMVFRLLGVFVTAFLLSLSQAFAHSGLANSVPADGAQLSETPPELILMFKEPVQITNAQLRDATGTDIDLPAPDMGEAVMEYLIPLPALAKGAYALEWRAISEDGHGIGGHIKFSVDQ